MVLLDLEKEKKLKSDLIRFLRDKFKGTIKERENVLDNFSPDYTINRVRKKRIVIFRNPPELPPYDLENINECINQGYGIYIATTYDANSEKMFELLLDKCGEKGIGVIKCKPPFKIIIFANLDIPQDKIYENSIKVFVSSKLYIEERKAAYDRIKKLRYQPICAEYISLLGKPWEEFKNRIDQSDFFVGIIMNKYRPYVNKEISYALRTKEKKCIIFVQSDLKNKQDEENKKLIEKIKPQSFYVPFNCCKDLDKKLHDKLPLLVKKNIK